MRIQRLDLLAFGPFTNRSLDFSEGTPGLHVIHGPNEAGKSSTLRALKAWLFGIDARSTDNFIHEHRQLRVGGVLETSGGRSIACVRRKGNKDTLLDPGTEAPIGDDTLSRLLPGLDENRFSQLHGIDHTALVQGGQAILEQGGDLGKSLFGAALGTPGTAGLLEDLASGADRLFRSRGQTQSINAAVAKLKDARREEKGATVSVREWKELQASLKQAEEAITAIEAASTEASRARSQLERFRRVAQPLAERSELNEQLAGLADVVALPEDFETRWRAAGNQRSLAREQLLKASTKLEALRQEAGALTIPIGLLDHQAVIGALQLELGAIQKAARDRPTLDARRLTHHNAARDLLMGVRPELDLDSVQTLKPLLNRRRLITDLAESWSLREQLTRQLDARQRELSDQLAGLRQQLEAIAGPGEDVSKLRAAIQAARRAGDLAELLRRARELRQRQEEICARDRSRLGRFNGSLAELASRAMPERAVLDRFEERFNALDEQARETRRRQAEAARELEQGEEALRSLLRASQVPSLDDLRAARDHREQGWGLIRRHLLEGAEPGAAATAFAGPHGLTAAYEQAVAVADEVADRLRLDAQRVQERASLETRIQVRQELLTRLAAQLDDQAAARSQLELEWQAGWDGSGIQVGSPREMKEWLGRLEPLLEKGLERERATAEVRRLEALEASHLEALGAELGRLGIQVGPGPVPLERLLARCEQVAGDQESATRRQGELQEALQKLTLQENAVLEDRRTAEDDRQRWEAQWAGAVDGLGLGANPHPALAKDTMEKLEALFEELKQADEARRRMDAIDRDAERFSASVTQLGQRIALDVKGQTPDEATRSMARGLSQALADAASLATLQGQIRELEEEVAGAHQDLALAEAQLADRRAEAGVSSDEDLVAVVERSNRKRRITDRLDDLHNQLRRAGEGHSIDELEQEARARDIDRVDEQLAVLGSQLDELANRRDGIRDQRQKLLVEIQALDGSSKAAEAAERAEQVLAGIIPDAEEYLRLTVARLILEEQMERYRQENQTPVLRRAGELFATLTLGSFTGLRDELDDKGRPVLLGLRPDRSEVPVSGMSEGSRDQLFLALRLATIALQGTQADPLPFVVDDILVGFDDARTRACLEVLASLGRSTQVLVFTHHTMVAQAAMELGRERGVFVHHLAASAAG